MTDNMTDREQRLFNEYADAMAAKNEAKHALLMACLYSPAVVEAIKTLRAAEDKEYEAFVAYMGRNKE